MKKSTFLMSLFSNISKRSGDPYFSATFKGSEPLVIKPGDRVTLVKSSKTASNGSEIWSLLKDDPSTPDEDRVDESTSNVAHRGYAPADKGAQERGWSRDQDEIPF